MIEQNNTCSKQQDNPYEDSNHKVSDFVMYKIINKMQYKEFYYFFPFSTGEYVYTDKDFTFGVLFVEYRVMSQVNM